MLTRVMLRAAIRARQSVAVRSTAQLQRIHARNLTGVSVGIPKETDAGETRVSITPQNAQQLIKKGASVTVESGAGAASGYTDAAFADAGAEIASASEEVWQKDVVMKVRTPSAEQCKSLGNRTIIGMLSPRSNGGKSSSYFATR